ncbi:MULTISPECIES: hypothetical protein [unclassified Nocardiopsis]
MSEDTTIPDDPQDPQDGDEKPKRPEPIVRGPRGIGTILPGLGWAFGD